MSRLPLALALATASSFLVWHGGVPRRAEGDPVESLRRRIEAAILVQDGGQPRLVALAHESLIRCAPVEQFWWIESYPLTSGEPLVSERRHFLSTWMERDKFPDTVTAVAIAPLPKPGSLLSVRLKYNCDRHETHRALSANAPALDQFVAQRCASRASEVLRWRIHERSAVFGSGVAGVDFWDPQRRYLEQFMVMAAEDRTVWIGVVPGRDAVLAVEYDATWKSRRSWSYTWNPKKRK